MATFIFRRPRTSFNVQGFEADDNDETDEGYKTNTCIACQRVHLVNPTTGKVAGENDD